MSTIKMLLSDKLKPVTLKATLARLVILSIFEVPVS